MQGPVRAEDADSSAVRWWRTTAGQMEQRAISAREQGGCKGGSVWSWIECWT